MSPMFMSWLGVERTQVLVVHAYEAIVMHVGEANLKCLRSGS